MAILKQSAWDLAQSLEIKFVGWDGDVRKLSDEQPDGIIDHLKTKVARFEGQSEMNSASRRIEDQHSPSLQSLQLMEYPQEIPLK